MAYRNQGVGVPLRKAAGLPHSGRQSRFARTYVFTQAPRLHTNFFAACLAAATGHQGLQYCLMRWVVSTSHPDKIEKLVRELGVPPLVARLLVRRRTVSFVPACASSTIHSSWRTCKRPSDASGARSSDRRKF